MDVHVHGECGGSQCVLDPIGGGVGEGGFPRGVAGAIQAEHRGAAGPLRAGVETERRSGVFSMTAGLPVGADLRYMKFKRFRCQYFISRSTDRFLFFL